MGVTSTSVSQGPAQGRKTGSLITSEPREGLFHALQGDVLHEQKRFAAAVASYNQALARNPGFFYFYLQSDEQVAVRIVAATVSREQ